MGLKKKSDIQNCYYLDSANVSVGYGDSEMTGVKCTNSDMQKKETFVGFDFNSTWKFIKENKFPVLMWQDGTERDNVPPISGGGGFALPIQVPPQSPEIETMDGVEVTLSEDGTTATISIKDGYLLTEVMVNGVSRGKTLIIQGLKTGDKVKVIVEKEEKNDGKSELLKKIKSVKLTTCSKIVRVKGKQAIKISCYEKEISGIDFDGFEIYRSTKRTKGYGKKPIFVAQKNQYYNTKVKAGVTYYYKARAFVEIDGNKQYTNWSTKSWRKIR